ncbi:MAG TPA: peptidylprolyl isomerase [Pilimelia sp.]|nr:peptidylprolyl isomerase [Pilimelia sp.]
MTSTRERQRAAARARLEKEMAERKSAARKRRQTQAAIGAGAALLVVVAGTIWLVTQLGGDDDTNTAGADPSANPAAAACKWIEVPKDQRSPTTKDVGLPPTKPAAPAGTQVMKVGTSFGDIEVTVDLGKAPCTATALSHLASKNFWDGTKCHRMFPGMLQCGDPSAKGKGYRQSDGTGGPTFRYASENLPKNELPAYPEGVVAMANSGANTDSNGSQFFFIYQDVQLQPDYTVLGKVSKGLDVLKKATAAGHDGAFDSGPGGGHPKSEVLIKDVTFSAPAA